MKSRSYGASASVSSFQEAPPVALLRFQYLGDHIGVVVVCALFQIVDCHHRVDVVHHHVMYAHTCRHDMESVKIKNLFLLE